MSNINHIVRKWMLGAGNYLRSFPIFDWDCSDILRCAHLIEPNV